MNLGEISVKLYDRLGYSTSPDSSVVRRIRGYVNDTQRELMGERSMAKLRRATLPFTSIANNPFAVLPQAVVGIAIIIDRVSRNDLDLISINDLRFRDPGLAMLTSVPDAYAIDNFAAPVALDPSAGATLFAISDSAADGTGISVNIEGVTAAGYYRKSSIAMNGLTAVQMDATITDWLHITKFYLSAGAAGNVTLHQASGVGTELARIPPAHTFARYTRIQLSPIPSTPLTYYADCEVHLEDMIGPKDEPLVPEDFHDILYIGALMKEYGKREKTVLYSQQETLMKKRKGDLRAFLRRKQGIAKGPNRQGGYSQLGPSFPAGS